MSFKWDVDGYDVRFLHYTELRALCQSLGLPHAGDRDTLQSRLLEFKSFPSHFTLITVATRLTA
jgi:hypothetical protein